MNAGFIVARLRSRFSRLSKAGGHRPPYSEDFSLSDNLHQYALLTTTVELAVKYLLPCAKVEFAVGDRHNNFTAHYLPLDVGICVVFSGVVMPVLINRRMRSDALQEVVIVF